MRVLVEKEPPRVARARPFPWKCSNCGKEVVRPAKVDYSMKVKHDGVIHVLHVPRLSIPRCRSCGNLVVTSAVDDKLNDILRAHFGLLTPDQIRANIQKLGISQQELGEWLDVAPETISRWMTGALIQSSRMNKRLRMFFAFPEAREMLRRLDAEPALGIEANLTEDRKRRIASKRSSASSGSGPKTRSRQSKT